MPQELDRGKPYRGSETVRVLVRHIGSIYCNPYCTFSGVGQKYPSNNGTGEKISFRFTNNFR